MHSKKPLQNKRAILLSFPARKGGVGKTMFVANTAGFLANDGYRVLVIGTDSQQDITNRYLGNIEGLDLASTGSFSDVLDGTISIDEAVITTPPYKRFIYGTSRFSKEPTRKATGETYTFDMIRAGQNIDQRSGDDLFIIRDRLLGVMSNYDFILFDTPPSESEAVMFVLMACDYAVIPVATNDETSTSIASIQGALENIDLANANGSGISCLGVVLNKLSTARKLNQFHNDIFRKENKDFIFKEAIIETANIPNSNEYCIPLCSFSAGDWKSGTASFYRFYQELLGRIEESSSREEM